MVMYGGNSTVGGGLIVFGNTLPFIFPPQDRLHSHTSDWVANLLRFTNANTGLTGTDGFRVGVTPVSGSGPGTGDVALFDQNEMAMFRFDMRDQANINQITKITIDNVTQNNTLNSFQTTYTDAARVGIWEGSTYFTGAVPMAMMHVGSPITVNTYGHRDWMNIGTWYNTTLTDGMYVGLRETAVNGTDAVVAWGDDGAAAGAQGDRLKFIFNSQYNSSPAYISDQADGLEVARMISNLGNDGAVAFNGGSIGGFDPLNTVHIVGQSPNGNAATAGGNSGLRLELLNATTPTITNPGQGVLSVDANGDVIYVNCCTSTASITAQNGLNMLNPTTVELGGPLLHHTDITTTVGSNLALNGTGQFAVTDYTTGFNTQASTLTGDYKQGVFTDSYQKASRLENIKTTAANAQYGEQILVDLDNISNLFTVGTEITVRGDNSNNASSIGINASASARTSDATNSGVLNAYGINASSNNAYHTWGGNFNASTTVVNTINTWTHGIECNATGGNLEALGGLFYGQGSPGFNKGVYAISRNNGTFPGTVCYGVHGLADAANAGGYNVGVLGIGNEYVFANITTTAIGIAGIIGSNSWGANYFPVGLRAGVFGSNQFAGTFGSPVSWAGYFDGDVMTTSATYYTSDVNLKKDVKKIEKSIDIIQKLNPVTYSFKEDVKGISLPNGKQYGFISQEIREILPELTKELHHGAKKDSTGKEIAPERDILALNYNGFIAILTKGMQEQQEIIESQEDKINDLQKQMDELKKLVTSTPAANTTNGETTYDVELSDKLSIVLDQNVPNPFAEQTTIGYSIPENCTKAQMLFYNAGGQLIKAVDITEKGKGHLNVFASDLSNGIYTYTLVVDGKIIQTRKMEKQR